MASIEPAMLWEATDAGRGAAAAVSVWIGGGGGRLAARRGGGGVWDRRRRGWSGWRSARTTSWRGCRLADGPLIAKCCGWAPAHPRLIRLAELLAWLEEEGLPVAVPLQAQAGARQVLVDGRSLGLLPRGGGRAAGCPGTPTGLGGGDDAGAAAPGAGGVSAGRGSNGRGGAGAGGEHPGVGGGEGGDGGAGGGRGGEPGAAGGAGWAGAAAAANAAGAPRFPGGEPDLGRREDRRRARF